MKAYRKNAAYLIKGNICAAMLSIIMPCLAALFVLAAELIIRRYFFPYYLSDIREFLILLVSFVLSAVLVYPLSFARRLCFYDNCTAKRIRLCGVFYCYSSGRLFFLSTFTVIIKKLTLFLLAALTVFPASWRLYRAFSENASGQALFFGSLSLCIIIFFNIAARYSLFLTEYIAAATGRNPFYCMGASVKYMRGRRCELFTVQLKFIPWFLICFALVPMIYVLPLYAQTAALFANDIIFSSPILPSSFAEDI